MTNSAYMLNKSSIWNKKDAFIEAVQGCGGGGGGERGIYTLQVAE